MKECSICDKHKNNHGYRGVETKNYLISHAPVEAGIFGYLYIEPLRHVEHWYDLSSCELNELTKIITILEKFLTEYIDAERVYVVTISEVVRHLHVHIIPRSINQDIKGVPLIAQATQQTKIASNNLTNLMVEDLIMKAGKYLKQI